MEAIWESHGISLISSLLLHHLLTWWWRASRLDSLRSFVCWEFSDHWGLSVTIKQWRWLLAHCWIQEAAWLTSLSLLWWFGWCLPFLLSICFLASCSTVNGKAANTLSTQSTIATLTEDPGLEGKLTTITFFKQWWLYLSFLPLKDGPTTWLKRWTRLRKTKVPVLRTRSSTATSL